VSLLVFLKALKQLARPRLAAFSRTPHRVHLLAPAWRVGSTAMQSASVPTLRCT